MRTRNTYFLISLTLLFFLLLSCKKEEENQMPLVTFLSPLSGSTIEVDSLVVVRVKAEDEEGVIQRLTLSLNGQDLKEVESSELNFVWDTEGIPAGEHTLKATAIDKEGASGEASLKIILKGNFAPVPSVEITPDTAAPNQAFSFDASGSSDIEDPLSALRFRWDWESDGQWDVNWTADPLAAHAYALPGSYSVLLEVRDSKGLTARDTCIAVVRGIPPVAAFSVQPPSGSTAVSFVVNAASSYDPDGQMGDLSFRWDWDGDGSWDTPFLNDTLALQKYAQAGIYSIRLQVRDADQLTDTTSQTVTVTPSGAGFGPCPGIPALVYAGKQYTTVKIGAQCWLRENLDIGTQVSPSAGQLNNPVIEKYCYNNQASNCQIFGGLYTWDEAMKYASSPQGICPLGWHIPSDAEMKQLEGHVDSQYDSLAGIWDSTGFRGFDAGRQLRASTSWTSGGSNPDNFGFTAFAGGGAYGTSASYAAQGTSALFWTSSANGSSDALARFLDASDDRSYRGPFQKVNAFSVRCIKD